MNFEEIDYIVNNKILNDKRIYKAFEPLIISSIKKYYDRADIFEELVDDGKTEIMYAIMEYDGSVQLLFEAEVEVFLFEEESEKKCFVVELY